MFAVNEKVLVPHTDAAYGASILKREEREGVWHYFLHYTGWNKKYDEWVEEVGLAKCAQPAGEMLPQVPPPGAAPGRKVAKIGAPAAAASGGAAGSVADAAGTGAGKKRGKVEGADPAALEAPLGSMDFPPPALVPMTSLELNIPPLLKKALLDDYEAVTEDHKLVPLPRFPNVAELLQQYVQQAVDEHGSAEAEEEACQGLRAYFDKALHVALLYQNERTQEVQEVAEGRVASSVYGAEHFLRLLCKLPDLLAAAAVSEDQLRQISSVVHDLMLWLADNVSTLLLSRDKYVVLSAVQGL